jgi:hypothetical protein
VIGPIHARLQPTAARKVTTSSEHPDCVSRPARTFILKPYFQLHAMESNIAGEVVVITGASLTHGADLTPPPNPEVGTQAMEV